MISDKEKRVIDEAVKTADRKYREKLDNLYSLSGAEDHCLHGLEEWLGGAAKWMYNNMKDQALSSSGIKVAERAEMMSGAEVLGSVCLQLAGRTGSITIQYRRRGDKSIVGLPGNPSPMKTATDTIDSAAWLLKRMDDLTDVAVRYVKAMGIVRDRELKDSDARAEKAMHQLELLKKL